ncbi:MAG: hypothetical protein RSB69_11845 [Odoribacter sp.]
MEELTTIESFQSVILSSNNIAEQNSASLTRALQVADTLISEIEKT